MRNSLQFFAAALLAVTLVGQQNALRAAEQDSDRSAGARQAAVEKRRAWLEERLVKLAGDAASRPQIRARLQGLSQPELERLMSDYLRERSAQQAAEREQRAAQQRDQTPEALAGLSGQGDVFPDASSSEAVGFVPLIGVFPDGVSLTASGVVSADGRFSRLSLFPTFSCVGPVYSFSYYPSYWYCYPYHPYYFGYPGCWYFPCSWVPRPCPRPEPPPRRWFDGVRMHEEPRFHP